MLALSDSGRRQDLTRVGTPASASAATAAPRATRPWRGDDPTDGAPHRQRPAGVVEGAELPHRLRVDERRHEYHERAEPDHEREQGLQTDAVVDLDGESKERLERPQQQCHTVGLVPPPHRVRHVEHLPDGPEHSTEEHEVDVEHGPSLCPNQRGDGCVVPGVAQVVSVPGAHSDSDASGT